MKAIKVESCGRCYEGMCEDYLRLRNGSLIPQRCPLSDWPTMTVKQVSAMFDHAVGIIGEGRGAKSIVDCLRRHGAEIEEKKNE